MRLIDLTGTEVGLLTVIRRVGYENGKTTWLVRCRCGTERVLRQSALRGPRASRSCGCNTAAAISLAMRTHGKTTSGAWCSWRSMIRRCYEVGYSSYEDYGARGITVCARWRDDFAAFFADMGDRPRRTTIDRIRNSDGYWCGTCGECVAHGRKLNCRWASGSQQCRNRTNNRHLTHCGRTMTIAGWAEETGIGRATISHRLKSGWSIGEALTTPADLGNRYRHSRAKDSPAPSDM